jgi:hypothetical protein
MRSAVLGAGSALVVLVEGCEPHSQVNRFIDDHGEGVSHVAFSVTDLDQALVQVKRSDLPTLPTVNGDGIRQVFLQRDARTGVRIELIERKGGAFTELSIETMFRVMEERDIY